MNKKLKDAIIKNVQENVNDFQLVNTVVDNFRAYIYDADGDYLIGGEKVSNFIVDFIKLYK
jgi:hypothetical protein